MKQEKRYQVICEMLQAYDQATGNRGADHVIKHPDQWIGNYYQPFYTNAAALIIEAREAMDKTGSANNKTIIPALKRIFKSSEKNNMDNLMGIFETRDIGGTKKYNACDGHRLVSLFNDIPSLSHTEQGRGLSSDSVNKIMENALNSRLNHHLNLPTVQELKAYIAEKKAKYGNKETIGYCIDNYIWVNPQYLIDMLQALPDCIAYKPDSPKHPIYFMADNGDGILCPVMPPDKACNKAA